jgi:hypothetical protein
MEQNQVQLSQLSDIQLKALAYDELAKLELAQSNIRAINQELANRVRQNDTNKVGDRNT